MAPTAGPPAAMAPGTGGHASRCQRRPQGTQRPAWLCLLLLLLTACVPTAGINPGIKAWLTRRTLEFGRRFGLELLQSLLQKEHELNLSGSHRIPLLGTLSYDVPRIHIQELQLNDSSLDFAEDVGVKLRVQRGRLRLSADWGARLGALQDKGSVELLVGDLAVLTVLGVGDDGGGRPRVWSASCDARGTDLNMQFRHGYSWLYNLLAPLVQSPLRQELNRKLCSELRRGVHRLEAALKHMDVSTQLDPFAAIDYSLLGPPTIGAEHGDVALKGEFFTVGKFQQRPSLGLPMALPVPLPVALPVALPVPLPTALPTAGAVPQEPMLLLAVTEQVANSAAFTYFMAGALRRRISSNMLLKQFPIQLRTKSMKLLSPQLQERYPDQPMELELWARQPPLLSCHPHALHGILFGSAEAFVVLPNATRVPAFLLNIDANVTGKPRITRTRLGGTVKLTGLSVTQVASQVGPVEVKRLETLLKFGLGLFGVPWANKRLQAGIPLPIPPGLSLLDPQLWLQEGFVLISTDLQDKP
ncbi:bactericidal permeability-increasing protein-like [Melanerpes formicivorus]|uniref:bactericidal permeability-increasing protein-like n=1 Tax=Melanerpes formicivorus TaxID=211600 RepID=UPI00358E418D